MKQHNESYTGQQQQMWQRQSNTLAKQPEDRVGIGNYTAIHRNLHHQTELRTTNRPRFRVKNLSKFSHSSNLSVPNSLQPTAQLSVQE